jgi:hypothetical protein
MRQFCIKLRPKRASMLAKPDLYEGQWPGVCALTTANLNSKHLRRNREKSRLKITPSSRLPNHRNRLDFALSRHLPGLSSPVPTSPRPPRSQQPHQRGGRTGVNRENTVHSGWRWTISRSPKDPRHPGRRPRPLRGEHPLHVHAQMEGLWGQGVRQQGSTMTSAIVQ